MDSWQYDKDKGWIRPASDKKETEPPKKKPRSRKK